MMFKKLMLINQIKREIQLLLHKFKKNNKEQKKIIKLLKMK